MLNVILPCAGKGTRLNLPYSKEIHKISPNHSLIDISLNLCKKNIKLIDQIVIVTEPHKKDLIKYLDKWKRIFNIKICYFNHNYFEWAGSILSAEKFFKKKNIVLLPDSIIEDKKNILFTKSNSFLDEYDVCFAVKKEKQINKFKSLGAIYEENKIVKKFCDKPSKNLNSYNCFWCSFSFTKKNSKKLLEMMTRSIKREKVSLKNENLYGKVFYINNYLDLGTWDNLRSNKIKNYD